MQWPRCRDRMDACDGIEPLGVLAAARERHTDAARLLAAADAARRPLQYLAPRFIANRGAAAHAASQTRHILGDDRFTQVWEQGQELTLDDAVAYAARKGGGRKRPTTGWASLTQPNERSSASSAKACETDAIARQPGSGGGERDHRASMGGAEWASPVVARMSVRRRGKP